MTPLQWAVLTAYASSLPRGDFRAQVEGLADRHAPHASRQGAARIVADAGGLTKGGRITHLGKLAALKVAQRHGAKVDKMALLDAIRREEEGAHPPLSEWGLE